MLSTAALAGFTFDQATHTYRLGDRVLPSVTQIIKPLYGSFYEQVDPDVLTIAAARGTAIHRLTEIYDEGGNPYVAEQFQPGYEPYIDAWMRFLVESGAEVIATEKRFYHPRLLFSGTCDRILRIDGRAGIADIKTTADMMPQTAIQTEGYRLIAEAETPPVSGHLARWGIQLRADGNYRLIEYRDPADQPVFLGLLAAHNWRTRHGVD